LIANINLWIKTKLIYDEADIIQLAEHIIKSNATILESLNVTLEQEDLETYEEAHTWTINTDNINILITIITTIQTALPFFIENINFWVTISQII